VSPAARATAVSAAGSVECLGAGWLEPVGVLLRRFGISLQRVASGLAIPHSYWGDPEAGIRGAEVWARDDTPVHSVLHEAMHIVCMDGARRAVLERDAGGDFDEENAVCLLQILAADGLPGFGGLRLMDDMDRWGYTFRLGSTAAWFASESAGARAWLRGHGLIDPEGRPTGVLRA
jgi:hypothetical protein